MQYTEAMLINTSVVLTGTNGEPSKSDHEFINEGINDFQIYGYMTLREVDSIYCISEESLAREIGIPTEEIDQLLGKLKKQYKFHLNNIRRIVNTPKNKSSHE